MKVEFSYCTEILIFSVHLGSETYMLYAEQKLERRNDVTFDSTTNAFFLSERSVSIL